MAQLARNVATLSFVSKRKTVLIGWEERSWSITLKMDENVENVDNDDIVIIVENEAESLPAEEERLKQQGTIGLMDTCPSCKLSFHNREPKLLPCLHSFCKRCLPAPLRGADPRRDPQEHVDNNKPCENTCTRLYFKLLAVRNRETTWLRAVVTDVRGREIR